MSGEQRLSNALELHLVHGKVRGVVEESVQFTRKFTVWFAERPKSLLRQCHSGQP